MEKGIEACPTLESDFAGLENGFTGVPIKIPAASRRFRTTGGKRRAYSIPSGQNRTAHARSDERGGASGYECRL